LDCSCPIYLWEFFWNFWDFLSIFSASNELSRVSLKFFCTEKEFRKIIKQIILLVWAKPGGPTLPGLPQPISAQPLAQWSPPGRKQQCCAAAAALACTPRPTSCHTPIKGGCPGRSRALAAASIALHAPVLRCAAVACVARCHRSRKACRRSHARFVASVDLQGKRAPPAASSRRDASKELHPIPGDPLERRRPYVDRPRLPSWFVADSRRPRILGAVCRHQVLREVEPRLRHPVTAPSCPWRSSPSYSLRRPLVLRRRPIEPLVSISNSMSTFPRLPRPPLCFFP
jgi:hypothetical protein